MSTNTPPPSNDLPRLLCLHGGGVTARIFRAQCRSLVTALSPYFRLVFADGPYICAAGPGIVPVYASYGPYRRWLRWLPEHPPVDDKEAAKAIERCMREAMEADDAVGGRGEWVGLVGFSQGSKVAASVLFEIQVRQDEIRNSRGSGSTEEAEYAGGKWKFAVLMAGRGPLVSLSERTYGRDTIEMPGALNGPPITGQFFRNQHRIRLPTAHIHGLKDAGLEYHRVLSDDFTTPGSAEIVEWDGDHRVPLKTQDVEKVVKATLRVAKKAGLTTSTQS